MSQRFRHPEIVEIARRDGRVTVESLADHFGVTHQTIRRDLTDLSEAGKLDRVHGGAVLPSGTTNLRYEDRRSLNKGEKVRIAEVCATRIPEDVSLFLGIGTSTEAVAMELMTHRNLLVVTNNINVANILLGNPGCQVIIAGGTLRRSDGGLVGHLTAGMIRQFKFDLAVIGCSAVDEDGDLLDYDMEEVEVSQTIVTQARTTFLVADSTKFHRTAPARVVSMARIAAVFTDLPLPHDLEARCLDWATEVCVAPNGRHDAGSPFES